jgi:ornithine carbamoyltransferase
MKIRHLLSISELTSEDILYLVDKALCIGRGDLKGARPLINRIVGIYFRRTSTRTRTAFAAGALRLGGEIIQYGPNDLQIVTGETVHDTGHVLSGYLDILVVRTNDSIGEMQALADQDEMAVINAMSENEHPTQAIADLATVREALGRLNDVHIMYIGEGNNTALALALALAKIPGMYLTLVTPEGYGLPANDIARCSRLAAGIGSVIDQHHRLDRLPKGVDVLYTTRWQTMGVPKADPNWREKFEPYKVTPELMERVSKPKGTIFLHDLPAIRGCEVLDEVLDGPQSLAFRQAKHKMNSAMAILSWCIFAD